MNATTLERVEGHDPPVPPKPKPITEAEVLDSGSHGPTPGVPPEVDAAIRRILERDTKNRAPVCQPDEALVEVPA